MSFDIIEYESKIKNLNLQITHYSALKEETDLKHKKEAFSCFISLLVKQKMNLQCMLIKIKEETN